MDVNANMRDSGGKGAAESLVGDVVRVVGGREKVELVCAGISQMWLAPRCANT